MASFGILGRRIGDGCAPFIIAEAGINHNGDINIAKEMIRAAKRAGADAVKFQTFHAEEFIQDRTTTYTYMSQGKEITEPMMDMFLRTEFSEKEWVELKKYCDQQGIIFLSTPQNPSDLKLLLRIGIPAVKIGSDDFVNIPLVREYSKTGLPILLSCGMANEEEIRRTLDESPKGKTVLLLCTSQYPTPACDVNIRKLDTLRRLFPEVVLGFSDHTQGIEAAIMAVAKGAKVFEKHFTVNHGLPGPDHWFSEEPREFTQWVDCIRKAYVMLGSSKLEPTAMENEMRKIAHRSITVLERIQAGDVFSEKNLGMRRPGDGLPASCWDQVIGKKATKDLMVGTQITLEDIDNG